MYGPGLYRSAVVWTGPFLHLMRVRDLVELVRPKCGNSWVDYSPPQGDNMIRWQLTPRLMSCIRTPLQSQLDQSG